MGIPDILRMFSHCPDNELFERLLSLDENLSDVITLTFVKSLFLDVHDFEIYEKCLGNYDVALFIEFVDDEENQEMIILKTFNQYSIM